jgi:hypothetical protein
VKLREWPYVRIGLHSLVAHCHLGLSKLYRRTGQREQAQEHLTTATTMYREMDMTYWLDQAETERRTPIKALSDLGEIRVNVSGFAVR